MNLITKANKLDLSYDFYIKHNVHAIEWNLNAMVNKNKILFDEVYRHWRYPLVRKFNHVPTLNL